MTAAPAAPLPVTVLTGFLGAGKTTLLRRALEATRGVRVGIVMNEIGVGGTDDLPAAETQLLELTSGCVCCTRNPELIAGLGEMVARGDVDRVVVETTGLADPLALTFTLERPDVRAFARLDCVVTVIDAAHHARARDVAEWQAQVRAADLVVLAKEDLVDEAGLAAVRAAVHAMNPVARIVRPVAEEVAPLLFDTIAPRTPGAGAPGPRGHSSFAAVSVAGREVYRLLDLEDWLMTLPESIFRAKGVVRTDEGWASFHVVAGRLQLEPGAAAPAHGESRLVFIGQALDEAALRAAVIALRHS